MTNSIDRDQWLNVTPNHEIESSLVFNVLNFVIHTSLKTGEIVNKEILLFIPLLESSKLQHNQQ
jgi:hypothetical protein